MRDFTQDQQGYITVARQLIEKLAQDAAAGTASSMMSTCVYDTAWVSMVAKSTGGEERWLIPESFDYVFQSQNSDGSWRKNDESQLDGILNSMAALLAFVKHQNSNIDAQFRRDEIASGISRATTWLQATLRDCDLQSCDQVAFEMLVPALLDLLRLEGIDLAFDGLDQILLVRDKKLSKLDLSSLYEGEQSTMAHCLEAFVGKVDFDRLEPLLRNGSMMASPSATAAYLIYCSSWNDAAENYLLSVYERGTGARSGAFPSAFPAEIFETSWALSTLLETSLAQDEYSRGDIDVLGTMLKKSLEESNDVVGFSSSMLADADDTSKALYALQLLDKPSKCHALVTTFGHHANFRTYHSERNPSISANCNVIKALLHSDQRDHYSELIEGALTFVCQCWLEGKFEDKWNLSGEYSLMLLAQTLAKVLSLNSNGDYTKLPDSLLNRLQIIVIQVVGYTLRTQGINGAWGSSSCEITAYAVLVLTSLAALPQCRPLHQEITDSVLQGRQYLLDRTGDWKPSRIWIEKVTYSSPVLTNAYCLAALYASEPSNLNSLSAPSRLDEKALKIASFFGSLPTFSHLKKKNLIMKTSVLEAQAFFPNLKQIQADVFPPSKTQDNKYLQYILLSWIACNNSFGQPLSTGLLWDMIEISMLNFQADNYIETTLNDGFGADLEPIRRIIDNLCGTPLSSIKFDETQFGVNLHHSTNGTRLYDEPSTSDNKLQDIKRVLGSYVGRVMSQPNVTKCPRSMQDHLRGEIANYLQAQVTSIQDSLGMADKQTWSRDCLPSLFQWARSTGADHTSCPYSYAYFICLITNSGTRSPLFTTAVQKYASQALVRHLATMCRMHNDYGSYRRDQAEGNFNCFSCVEFDDDNTSDPSNNAKNITSRHSDQQHAKQQLLKIAKLELQGVQNALSCLEASPLAKSAIDQIRLFVSVTDLFGQIYLARDIGLKSA